MLLTGLSVVTFATIVVGGCWLVDRDGARSQAAVRDGKGALPGQVDIAPAITAVVTAESLCSVGDHGGGPSDC